MPYRLFFSFRVLRTSHSRPANKPSARLSPTTSSYHTNSPTSLTLLQLQAEFTSLPRPIHHNRQKGSIIQRNQSTIAFLPFCHPDHAPPRPRPRPTLSSLLPGTSSYYELTISRESCKQSILSCPSTSHILSPSFLRFTSIHAPSIHLFSFQRIGLPASEAAPTWFILCSARPAKRTCSGSATRRRSSAAHHHLIRSIPHR